MKNQIVRTMAHDLSNKLMIMEGYISLMLLDEAHRNTENVQKLAAAMESATSILTDFKSSDDYERLTKEDNQ